MSFGSLFKVFGYIYIATPFSLFKKKKKVYTPISCNLVFDCICSFMDESIGIYLVFKYRENHRVVLGAELKK